MKYKKGKEYIMKDKVINNNISKTEDQNKSLIEKLHKFNSESNIGITVSNVKDLEEFKIVYSNLISDYWWNFILLNVKIRLLV